jgi:hypothetical protein
MTRHTIKIERNEFGNFSSNTLGTDAWAAIAGIPGTNDIRIEEDGEQLVVMSYAWSGLTNFEDTATVLAKHYCKRVEW